MAFWRDCFLDKVIAITHLLSHEVHIDYIDYVHVDILYICDITL